MYAQKGCACFRHPSESLGRRELAGSPKQQCKPCENDVPASQKRSVVSRRPYCGVCISPKHGPRYDFLRTKMKAVHRGGRRFQTRRHSHSHEAEAPTERTWKEENTSHCMESLRDMCCTSKTCANPAQAGQHSQMHDVVLEMSHGPWASTAR